MRVLSVSWDPDRDITKLKFNEHFLVSDWVVRADVLQDLIHDLTVMYDGMLTKPKEEEKKA